MQTNVLRTMNQQRKPSLSNFDIVFIGKPATFGQKSDGVKSMQGYLYSAVNRQGEVIEL